MPSKKIVGLGGGSLYFPNAIADLLLSKDLAGSEIVLYDIDGPKVELMAAMGRRIARRAGTRFKIRPTTVLADALEGADFALASIGGSGAEVTPNVYGSSFHAADIGIPARYGIRQIIGDTCGPAGMMMAFRSIPVYLRICREMEKRCPRAILFNHSNPMAVLMRAMHKHSSITSIGICHGVYDGIGTAARMLNVPADELECLWIGTNHYYWFTRVLHNGRDVYGELMKAIARRPHPKQSELTYRLSEIYGHAIAYASDDHTIEFLPFLAQLSGGTNGIPAELAHHAMKLDADQSVQPRAKRVSPQVHREFLKKYKAILDKRQLPPHRTDSEDIGRTIAAMATRRRHLFVANIPNRGVIPNLPDAAEVEVEAVTDSRGCRGVYMGEAPAALKGILEKRFAWQEAVADAAVTGDRRLAMQALMLDEMAIWPDKAQAMLDELLAASKELLPQFFGRQRVRRG